MDLTYKQTRDWLELVTAQRNMVQDERDALRLGNVALAAELAGAIARGDAAFAECDALKAELAKEHAAAAGIYGQSVKDACDEALGRLKHEAREANAGLVKWRDMSQRHETNWNKASQEVGRLLDVNDELEKSYKHCEERSTQLYKELNAMLNRNRTLLDDNVRLRGILRTLRRTVVAAIGEAEKAVDTGDEG
jgi:chromosome segregation ATPase